MTFEFTHDWTNLDSSLVKGVWFDGNTNTMLVRLVGDRQYKYINTELEDAASIGNSVSPGHAYNDFRNNRPPHVKGEYADNETVIAREKQPVAMNITNGGVTFNGSVNALPTRLYTVEFKFRETGYEFPVEAISISHALDKIDEALDALGMNDARVVGVWEN